ncbi:DNA alkylation repair protein [Peterkaempfera bronchialis]|uniref:DNA alkylation repair protein n=1 Tax=Peterkaempfera bronchialis TaxID=2126346 RepID=A0A345T002_9ACTN|nr:DNA alkylation repair protein [Peterkaempfera bronchialis]AXI79307.1 DNA alkylation repair protein [Peterkaempfera bronchialis]
MPSAEELLSHAAVVGLADCLGAVGRQSMAAAVRGCVPALGDLALRERCDLVREALLSTEPEGCEALEATIRAALPDPRFTGWMIWPVTEAVAERASREPEGDAFERALQLLADLTPRLTSEFAVRRLLNADLDRAMAVVKRWTAHPDEHVRRLASEGTRPRLPWAVRVPAILADPDVTLPVLDALYRDPSEYVRRSVANHLNDISHARPDLAVATAGRWAGAPDGQTSRLIRHALRTVVKRGDREALALLGFKPTVGLKVEGPTVESSLVQVGEDLRFRFTVENQGDEQLRLAIDYVVHYRKASGATSPKVFKLAVRTLGPGERSALAGVRSFAPISTRVVHPGMHALELQINGESYGRTDFEVAAAARTG